MDSPDRADFLKHLKPGGKYAGISGVYRHNISSNKIGIFDAEIISALAETGVKWIGHNGAGYDQIDIPACISEGEPVVFFAGYQRDVRSRYQSIEHARGR